VNYRKKSFIRTLTSIRVYLYLSGYTITLIPLHLCPYAHFLTHISLYLYPYPCIPMTIPFQPYAYKDLLFVMDLVNVYISNRNQRHHVFS
jgi:hypothetical protein